MSPDTDRIALADTKRFERDVDSKALVSTDKVGLGAYKIQRRNSQQVVTLERDINTLRNEMEELKELLKAKLTK